MIVERNTYIKNTDEREALNGFIEYIGQNPLGYEVINVLDSVGRVTYEPIFARFCDPVYNASAMDGIAVIAEETFGASELEPKILSEGTDFVYINTGGAVTGNYNAVIMIEDIIKLAANQVKIIAPAYPWQYVRTVGESIVSGEMIIASHHKIRPVDLGALIAGGTKDLKVYKKPTVGIIPTGSELIENPDELSEGKLMESNSRVFAALVQEYGGIPVRYSPIKDEWDILKAAIQKAAEDNDIVLVNAGSSAGTKDFTVKVIEELGEVFTHGIAVKPGKPTILGAINQKPVIGIPGYPVSAYLIFQLFAAPLISRYVGLDSEENNTVDAILTRRIVSSFKNSEILRVSIGFVNDKIVATPLDKGAAAIMSLVKADGILRVPRLCEGIEAGETVTVSLLKTLSSIKNTLVVTGSHDMIMDVIADKVKLASSHVGSMGGITALRRGECHLAPIHLLDEATGEYNISYVKTNFPGRKMALIKGVNRIQGFILPKGNPLNIQDFTALKDKHIRFANRQRGAGTRLLFDYKLKQLGMEPTAVNGYEKEFNTHMAVAISVKMNVSDVGLGVYSAAKAMDLDFIPVGAEEYDFLMPYEYLEDPRIGEFIEFIQSDYFKAKLVELGGYSAENIGKIITIQA